MLWTHNLFAYYITGKFFSASSCGGLLIFASVINKLSNEFYFTVCSSFFSPFFGVFLIIFWSFYFFPFNFYSLNLLVNGRNIVLNVALMSLFTLHIHFNSFLMFWALIILVGCLSLFSFAFFFFFLAGEINRGAKVSTLLQLMKNQHKYFHCFATLYEFVTVWGLNYFCFLGPTFSFHFNSMNILVF